MTPEIIQYIPSPTDTCQAICNRVAKMARNRNKVVQFTDQGIAMQATPESEADDLFSEWWRLMQARDKAEARRAFDAFSVKTQPLG